MNRNGPEAVSAGQKRGRGRKSLASRLTFHTDCTCLCHPILCFKTLYYAMP